MPVSLLPKGREMAMDLVGAIMSERQDDAAIVEAD